MKSPARIRRLLALQLGVVAMLLPLASGTPAQTDADWRSQAAAASQQPQPAGSALDQFLQSRGQPVADPLAPASLPFDAQIFEGMAMQLVADQRIPGFALAIVQDGRILSARGYGVTDTQRPEPVDAHTVFRLASLSKSFAGTLGGMLVEDGTLDWQQPVVRYVPDFRLQNAEFTSRLSIGNILSQSTGLPRNAYDRDIERNASYQTVRGKLATSPLSCGPGECYSYQNVAFSVFGDVVYSATGRLYDDNVQRRILKPLGMHDASLGLEGITGSPRWAKPHVRTAQGWRPVMPKPTYYRLAPAASIQDMAQYLLAQTGHRPDVLSSQLLASVHAIRVQTPNELRSSSWRRERLTAAGYGMGWRIYDYAGHPMYFHGGAVQGYRAAMAILPDRNLGVVMLWNSESSLPSGLLPTILDSAIGLPQTAWLNLAPLPSTEASDELSGDASTTVNARPN
ncbi:MAG: serine hydrolase domain-containing protein [Pseudomonadota bacterium]|nr:serine hydrolase domain-containing protein [Pseudomonadota bacterium]